MRVRNPGYGMSLLLLIPAAGVIGCSSFNREWRAAQPAIEPAPTMAGRWAGTWQSAVNGHQGQLRAILTPTEHGKVDARFRARFWRIMAYSYRLELGVESTSPGHWVFEGEADLGWLAGGRFRCRGTTLTNELRATYESKRDHGTFTMSRASGGP
jgi:hypothetical protein